MLCEMIVAQGSVTQWNQPIKIMISFNSHCAVSCTWLSGVQVFNRSWLWSHWEVVYQFACAWKYAGRATFSANRYPKWWNHGRTHVTALCERLDKKPSRHCGYDVLLREWRILEGKTCSDFGGVLLFNLEAALQELSPDVKGLGPHFCLLSPHLTLLICHEVWTH